jgi:SAM-dependent methyltransferase
MTTDWNGWLQRWEAQQTGHLPDREERFRVIIDAVAAHCGPEPRILDLGSGPGSLARRLVEMLPGAHVVAIDMDPVLLEIGRQVLGVSERISFVDADLGGDLATAVGADAFDAAVSTTALHWLTHDSLASLYRSLARLLRPGGILLNGDRLRVRGQLLADSVQNMKALRPPVAAVAGAETWDEWWENVVAEPGLAAQVAERAARHHDHPHEEQGPDVADHIELLRAAGFAEVDTLWQHLDDRVLAAIR